MATGYCVKCRTKREIEGASPTVLRNGKAAIRGTCGTCNTKMFRMGRS